MTWTDLLNRPDGATVAVDAATFRNLLMDLIGHPGVWQVQRATLTLRDGRRMALSLGDRPPLEAGASGPIVPGAAGKTRDVAPLVYEAPPRPAPPPGEWAPELVDVSAWRETARATEGELREVVQAAVAGQRPVSDLDVPPSRLILTLDEAANGPAQPERKVILP